MRVEIRDAEWRIRQIDRASDGGELLTCEGLSELVRGREGRFLTRIDQSIRVLAPEDTELVNDDTSNYQASLLYIDTAIRKTPAAGETICLGHRAALDPLPFQFDPALQALGQPRPRILIADAVGLGKTLEAGILTSELIARGQGKRILVLAVKSMLAQFQQEFWNRFAIPLVRLDSTGLQRVRNRIPANHNPFHYFDRAIISIDTLKQDIDYRHYLEQAYWDIIIIDEAHNVADRGARSQRARLAQLLSTRSDALIMLSATPHDGKAESFASLVNMLDPTAIANPSDYAHEDFRDKGLVIRRFKKDVADQLGGRLPEREIDIVRAAASAAEEAAYQQLEVIQFRSHDGRRGTGGAQLFRTTLKKALYSSPAACLSTLDNRIRTLTRKLDGPNISADLVEAITADIDVLNGLRLTVQAINDSAFSKYQELLRLLSSGPGALGWDPRQSDDRLVIFTESIRSLEYLHERLARDLKLKVGQIGVLRGDAVDRDLMEIVEDFGRRESPLRLLLCSDVAAEGINLHHLSHRLVHFDVPWSLMTFQQRNGRIDRYGQTRSPQIRYLITEPQNRRILGEQRVLEVLIAKDEQAGRNIGDPSEFMGLYSQDDEEAVTARYIEGGEAADPTLDDGSKGVAPSDDLAALFSAFLDQQLVDGTSPLDAFLPARSRTSTLDQITQAAIGIYATDFDYAHAAIHWLRASGVSLQAETDSVRQVVTLTAPPDLQERLGHIAPQSRPEGDRFILTPDRNAMQEELRRRRDEDSPWAERQFLWPLHPVMEWLADRAQGAFGRHTAPVIRLPGVLAANESAFLMQGGYPNRRGYPLVHGWVGVHLRDGAVYKTYDLAGLIDAFGLQPGKLPNRGGGGDTEALRALLPVAVQHVRGQLRHLRATREAQLNQRLEVQMREMDALKSRHLQQLELDLAGSQEIETRKQRRRTERQQRIEQTFADYLRWLEDTQMLEEQPYIQVVAAFAGQVN
tara:strand:+ start:3769 stop:6687 length:2919 start_codon:yes stop_codon:yes gene_type:complete